MKILRILLLSIIFSTVAIGQGLMVKDVAASALTGKTIYKYVLPTDPLPVTVSGDESGNLLTTPYLSYIRSSDTWGAAADTSTYDFGNTYLKCYVTIYDSSATADTLVIENYSYAKLGWTTNAIGFMDVYTNYLEADNSLIIVAGTYAKTYEININRPGQIRVRPKTLTGRSAYKTKRITFMGVN